MFEGAWVSVPIGPTSASGTQYAIVLSTTDPELYLVGGATTDAYTGGQPLVNSGAGWSTSGSFVEFAFKTYVLNALAVTFRCASALRTGKGVVVRWRTAWEVETPGFNVYRQISGKRLKLNRHLIPARSSLSGAAYSYRDRRAPRALPPLLAAGRRPGRLTHVAGADPGYERPGALAAATASASR